MHAGTGYLPNFITYRQTRHSQRLVHSSLARVRCIALWPERDDLGWRARTSSRWQLYQALRLSEDLLLLLLLILLILTRRVMDVLQFLVQSHYLGALLDLRF